MPYNKSIDILDAFFVLWVFLVMLLKDIPDLLPTLEGSLITKSKIWEMDVSEIQVFHLRAIRAKGKLEGQGDKIDQDIEHLFQMTLFAELDGLIENAPLTDYYNGSEEELLTTREFVAGLTKLPPEYRQAVLFGMECQLSANETATLTVKNANKIENLPEMAKAVLDSATLSIKTPYLFWKRGEGRSHVYLGDLGIKVIQAYGFGWDNLLKQYPKMITDHFEPLDFEIMPTE